MIAPTPKFEFLVESPGKDESQKKVNINSSQEWRNGNPTKIRKLPKTERFPKLQKKAQRFFRQPCNKHEPFRIKATRQRLNIGIVAVFSKTNCG